MNLSLRFFFIKIVIVLFENGLLIGFVIDFWDSFSNFIFFMFS